jgi:hypothetical protein
MLFPKGFHEAFAMANYTRKLESTEVRYTTIIVSSLLLDPGGCNAPV